ncbi:hypothetical protein BP5796_01317 [Coleophoma crateriformis]|uniref:H/ACA ribonucleoprotein complex non-core subunit NAF1 n=1 Tax=Coleophoma crateriformis TaxID=565419 RepID=A0A3D8T028_9HELO|nr:hypothetical protein BP5796_01317 [Coleophoma crateriformis]
MSSSIPTAGDPVDSKPAEVPQVSYSGIPGLGLLGNAPKPSGPLPEAPVQTETDSGSSAPPQIETTSISDTVSEVPPFETSVVPDVAQLSVTPMPAKAQVLSAETITNQAPKAVDSPADLLGFLEATITGPEDDSVMAETPQNPATVSSEKSGEQTKAAQNTSADKMEFEATGVDKAPTEEPVEEVNTEIEDAEMALHEAAPEGDLPAMVDAAPVEGEHPEWEVDSSPYESSSDDSSSDDSSSEDSDEGDDAYKLLDPEEQARILMEGDGGSDDEGGGKGAKGAGGQLRTKNEIPEEIIPKPDVTLTPEMKIEELGSVEGIVENTALIKAKTSGEYRVLESGSVLCLQDRSVIGAVAETIGRVQQPFYSVRFTNAAEIAEAGLSIGTTIYYSEQHSTYVFTQTLKAFKGSDASNLHDEEVGDDEIEFSDDEAEAEHKRRVKQKKLERRGGKMQQNGNSGRGGHGHPLQQQHSAYDASVGIKYDDEEDGPYKPLARPAGFADTVGRSEAPEEGGYQFKNERPSRGGHDQGRGRGRGDRGRGRGRGNDRGRGRGGSGNSQPQGRRDDAHSHPQPGPAGYANPQSMAAFQPPPPGTTFPMAFPPPPPNYYNPAAAQAQYSPQQPQMWPQFPAQPPSQQQYPPQPYMQPGWPNNGTTGAFINPAFFAAQNANQWNPQGQNQGGPGNGGK